MKSLAFLMKDAEVCAEWVLCLDLCLPLCQPQPGPEKDTSKAGNRREGKGTMQPQAPLRDRTNSASCRYPRHYNSAVGETAGVSSGQSQPWPALLPSAQT